jgi:hypothetical protein
MERLWIRVINGEDAVCICGIPEIHGCTLNPRLYHGMSDVCAECKMNSTFKCCLTIKHVLNITVINELNKWLVCIYEAAYITQFNTLPEDAEYIYWRFIVHWMHDVVQHMLILRSCHFCKGNCWAIHNEKSTFDTIAVFHFINQFTYYFRQGSTVFRKI